MPNLPLKGGVIRPARVVAPIRVNFLSWSLWLLALGPCPMTRSRLKSSMAAYMISSTEGWRRWISSMNRISFP